MHCVAEKKKKEKFDVLGKSLSCWEDRYQKMYTVLSRQALEVFVGELFNFTQSPASSLYAKLR